MDFHIRLWDENNKVATRYYNSEMLGKSLAQEVSKSTG